MTDIVLTLHGRDYQGWTQVRVRRGIEQLAGSFELSASERWTGQTQPWPIHCGDACTVAADNDILITGYVDDVQPQIDAHSHMLRIAGRDAAGDLVDCSAANSPGRWNNRTLLQIARDLCEPFGITVRAEVDTGARFRDFALEPGEAVFEAIERMCRFRGVLPVSDGAGALVFTRAGKTRAPVRLVQGENILAASGLLSWRDRYSRYVVKGQAAGFDESAPDQNAGPMGEATDPGVTRYRPLIIIAENPGDSAQLEQRALWEAAVRRGRSTRATVSIQGWRHTAGPWQPNHLVRVKSDWLQIDTDMLIAAVTFIRDDNGTRSQLELCPPAAFALMALPENKEQSLWRD